MYIETERLILRPHTPDDFEDYFGYIMEPELQRMLGLNGVEDRESALETFQWLLDKWRLDKWEFLAVVGRETGRVIGHICVQPPVEQVAQSPEFQGKKGASLSFAIAKWERRKGLMAEALSALIGQMFRDGTVDYLGCEYPLFNTASRELQKKLGFRYWGAMRFDDEDLELIINILQKEGVDTAAGMWYDSSH